MKTGLLLYLLALPLLGTAQNSFHLRKTILKSDLIISTNNYSIDTIRPNDFTLKVFINLKDINDQNSIIYKNSFGKLLTNLSLRDFQDGEDYSSYLVTNGGGCIHPAHRLKEELKTYRDLFFVRKVKNEYQILAHYQSLELEQLTSIKAKVTSLTSIEKIKDGKERYQAFLDWFIENGQMPDPDFIDYYRKQKIIQGKIAYSENQLQKAMQQFLDGKEELLPMVREHYFEEIKAYYLEKMEEIAAISEPDYWKYSAFVDAVNLVTDSFNSNSSSINSIMNYSLTGDKFETYEKDHIMDHLIHVVKNWKVSDDEN